MAIAPFDRRALLRTGAAAGTLAVLGGVLPGSARSAPMPLPPLRGSLIAWVVLHPEHRADIRLVHLDRGHRLAGQSAPLTLAASQLSPDGARLSAWGQMRAATTRAQTMAVAAAARSWEVPPETCAVHHGRIAHAASGRSVAYGVWVETA